MISVVVFVTLLVAVTVALVRSAQWRRRLPTIGGVALALGLLVFVFFVFAPKDYLVRWPSLSSWLHPYQLVWYSGILCIFAVGTFLGSAARWVFRPSRSDGTKVDTK